MTRERDRKRWHVRLGRVWWTYLGGVSLAASGVLGALALRPWWADIVAGVVRWWTILGAVSMLGIGVAAIHHRTTIGADNARLAETSGGNGGSAAGPAVATVRRPLSLGLIVLAAAVGVLGIAGLVLAALWDWSAAPGLNAKDAANTRIETVKIAASVAVAGGGLFALYLAARRQRTQEMELTQRRDEFAHSEHDATERRVTELYTKAVEQLGSERAVVRQGGLYALERVAHDNPPHRQTVINVICAYLRAPYTPPPERLANRRTGLTARSSSSMVSARVTTTPRAAQRATLKPPTLTPTHEGLRQEREVRLTAQRILAAHLRPDIDPDTGKSSNPRYWPEGYDVDLTGSTLIDLDMTDCHIVVASFRDASLSGDVRFDGTTFSGDAGFDGATFSDFAGFSRTTFSGEAKFNGAIFSGYAEFYRAKFSKYAEFSGATFSDEAEFDRATFSDGVAFDNATFSGDAGFHRATFSDYAEFSSAIFFDYAGFDRATFSGSARFNKTMFSGDTSFGAATFSNFAGFRYVTFSGEISFEHVTFSGNASFTDATFSGDTSFDHAAFALLASAHGAWVRVDQPTRAELWPTGWTVDASSGAPKHGQDGRWAPLVPVPIVLAPLPPEPTDSK